MLEKSLTKSFHPSLRNGKEITKKQQIVFLCHWTGTPEQRKGRGAVKKLRAMETCKKKSSPIMLVFTQQQC